MKLAMNPDQHNVNIIGDGARTLMLAHGYGCDQHMWRSVADLLAKDYRIVLFDYIGFGGSDVSAYDPVRYSSLDGYADDVVALGQALGLERVVFVGHSVSAMIGVLASIQAPELFTDLVLVGPSPHYLDEDGYHGGFARGQIDEMLDFLNSNHLGWSRMMAPAIVGNPERPELGETLTNSFCATDPKISRDFARVTFLTDCREDLKKVSARTLVLQSNSDIIAPVEVGEYTHRNIANSEYKLLNATGHCPNLSAPREVAAAIRSFV